MLKPFFTKQFNKDVQRMKKRGKTFAAFKRIVAKLVNVEKLEPARRNHKLLGKFKNRLECHIEADWLLIYKRTKEEIIFERTGTHSDLFV